MDDITNPDQADTELAFESALRPKSLDEFVGQNKVREQVSLIIEAARIQGRTADHILLAGPPGLGKTTLAMIVAHESGAPLRLTSGPTIQHAGDLAAVLSSLAPGEVLFIDEIHRMARAAEEMLYLAMEDFRVDVMVGKGPGATSIPLELAPFTLVGATTRSGMLPNPLRDRFGFTAHLEFYEVDELREVIARAAIKLGLNIDQAALVEIASRSRGTPRIANRLLRRVRDFAQIKGSGSIDNDITEIALKALNVDSNGLDEMDIRILKVLIDKFNGGPVGLSTIATAIGENAGTLEEVYEPFLIQEGFLMRTPRGRKATEKSYKHLGKDIGWAQGGLF